MSRSVSPTRVVIAVGAVAGALALAGCGAGQITQTSTQISGVDGASANIGQIGVRAAEFPFAGDGKTAVVYANGGTAPLSMTVANFGATPDKLTRASSPVASSVNITGDGTISAGKLLLVEGEPAPSAPSAPSAAPSEARPRASAGASATPSASVAPAAPTAAAVPTTAGSTVEPAPAAGSTASAGAAAPSTSVSPVGTTSAQVVLTGLKEDLKAGLTYPVVLTFQRAGDVTVQVPIGNPSEGAASG